MLRYIFTRGQTFGPADLDRLILWVQEGRIGPDDWVWIDEEDRWESVKNIPEFKDYFKKSESKFYSAHLASTSSPSLSDAEIKTAPLPIIKSVSIPDELFEHEGLRHYVRLETFLDGRYYEMKSQRMPTEKDLRPCRVLNISIGGASVEMNETLETGTSLRLEIDLMRNNRDLFCIQSRVMRTGPGIEFGMTEHGMQFAAMPELDKKRLIDFLEKTASKK